MLTQSGNQISRASFSAVSYAAAMTLRAAQTALFTLPLELRELIYRAVVASPLQGPQLLQTCREIYEEAYKCLFERPIIFRGQVALFDWLNQVPRKFLSHVKEVSLTVQDIDLKSLLDATALVHHPGDPPRLLTWNLYEAELGRLSSALKQLPNVKRISIAATTGRQSFLYREFLRQFLVELSLLYPELVDIHLSGNFHHQELTFLGGFTKLRFLSFDGFSASSPIETARILSGLEHLTDLSLVSQSTLLTPDTHTHSSFTTKRQSLTGGVVKTIDSLRTFSVTEIVPESAPSLFFTPEVLIALAEHRCLKKIQVCLSQAPDNDTLAALETFLRKTHILILELDWPKLDPHVLETFSLIPECLETLWVRAKDKADAFEIIWSISECREAGDHNALNELVILRSMDSTVADRKDSCAESVGYDPDRVSPHSDSQFYHTQHVNVTS